jgi:hypothetical protein
VKKPRNTAVEAFENPSAVIENAKIFGANGSIEKQEADGQRDFVSSETLPTRIDAESKQALEAAGVKFLGPVENDNLFQYVELPAGWQKKPTDHSMWSLLFDDKGVQRASIFYKAAFYDRDAFLRVDK